MADSCGRCTGIIKVLMLTSLVMSIQTVFSAYVDSICTKTDVPVTISCQTNEVIRIRETILTAVHLLGAEEATCEPPGKNNYCQGPSNRSDPEFVGRQSASYMIESEDLKTNPKRTGDCSADGIRSTVAQIFYECVPTQGGRFLQSICNDILWENEVSGYLVSPYFPNEYPADSEQELECECELRPEDGSRVELLAVLINPSTSGLTWSLHADTGSGFTQDLSIQPYISRILQLPSATGSVKLMFTTQGSGTQRPAKTGPPPGFWLEYRAVSTDPTNVYQGEYGRQERKGRVTLICNDPYDHILTAGIIAIIVIAVILVFVIVVVVVVFIRRRSQKGKSYSADRPHVYSGRTNSGMQIEASRTREEPEDYNPEYNPYERRRIQYGDYPEKAPPSSGRVSERSNSNNSYNDKVFLDEVDIKSVPSSGRSGDNDSIAKKSISLDSQADNYSEVNYSPKGSRLHSLGRDTAV